MIDDAELLRRYAEDQSEPAFAELVQRHVNVVYAAALRRVGGDPHLAEEVAQAVFTTLARKAGTLARHPALLGWLHRSTRYAAIDVLRDRLRRERQAQAVALEIMHAKAPTDPNRGGEIAWEEVRPVIDALLDRLEERDRSALLLRFFEGHSYSQIGTALRLGEDAARMRVDRALDKLRAALARRGVTSTTAALGAALATQAAVAAPAGLAGSLTGTALAATATATGAAGPAGAIAALLAIMSTGKTMVGLGALAAAVAVGVAFVTASRAREADARLSAAAGSLAALDARIADLERQAQLEGERVAQAETENSRLLRAAAEKPASVVVEEPVTSDVVFARMAEARQLVTNGDYPAALEKTVWLFDVGLKRTMVPVRLSWGVALFAELAGQYPPARAALDARRAAARQKMLADPPDRDATNEYGAITRELKDTAAALALLEAFPPGDRRRAEMARAAFDDLLESRRYALALEGRPPAMMLARFESTTRDRPNPAQTEDQQRESRAHAIERSARDVEVLAGAGQLADARTLAQRLLAYDASESTRALLQQHLARAGRPDLLSSPRR